MGSRWLIGGLIVSVALNLFLIGVGAGVIALGMRLARENPGRPAALLVATQRLPQPARAGIRQMLRGVRDETRAQSEQSRTLRLGAWDGLAAAKPDTAAIKQALAQSRQLDIGVRTKVEESVVDYAAQLSPADRAALAAGFHQQLAPPPPKN
jgi:uncharacterized membrane protein